MKQAFQNMQKRQDGEQQVPELPCYPGASWGTPPLPSSLPSAPSDLSTLQGLASLHNKHPDCSHVKLPKNHRAFSSGGCSLHIVLPLQDGVRQQAGPWVCTKAWIFTHFPNYTHRNLGPLERRRLETGRPHQVPKPRGSVQPNASGAQRILPWGSQPERPSEKWAGHGCSCSQQPLPCIYLSLALSLSLSLFDCTLWFVGS